MRALCLFLFISVAHAQSLPASTPSTAPTSLPQSQPASTQTMICGDGIVALSEACDDGNRVNSDGCSEACAVEHLVLSDKLEEATIKTLLQEHPFVVPSLLAGGGTFGAGALSLTAFFNRLSDTQTTALGVGIVASSIIAISGVAVDAKRAKEQRDAVCGNKAQEVGESCDDGNNTSQDGCSSVCEVERTQITLFREGIQLQSLWGRELSRPLSYTPIKEKSPQRAFRLSLVSLPLSYFAFLLGTTGSTTTLIVGGVSGASLFMVGPSLGYWYLGEKRHTLRLSLLRLAGLSAVAGGVGLLTVQKGFIGAASGQILSVTGVVTTGFYTLGDLWYVKSFARRVNKTIKDTPHTPSVLPILIPTPQGSITPGLALQKSF